MLPKTVAVTLTVSGGHIQGTVPFQPEVEFEVVLLVGLHVPWKLAFVQGAVGLHKVAFVVGVEFWKLKEGGEAAPRAALELRTARMIDKAIVREATVRTDWMSVRVNRSRVVMV